MGEFLEIRYWFTKNDWTHDWNNNKRETERCSVACGTWPTALHSEICGILYIPSSLSSTHPLISITVIVSVATVGTQTPDSSKHVCGDQGRFQDLPSPTTAITVVTGYEGGYRLWGWLQVMRAVTGYEGGYRLWGRLQVMRAVTGYEGGYRLWGRLQVMRAVTGYERGYRLWGWLQVMRAVTGYEGGYRLWGRLQVMRAVTGYEGGYRLLRRCHVQNKAWHNNYILIDAELRERPRV